MTFTGPGGTDVVFWKGSVVMHEESKLGIGIRESHRHQALDMTFTGPGGTDVVFWKGSVVMHEESKLGIGIRESIL
jgi:hypothetical protein